MAKGKQVQAAGTHPPAEGVMAEAVTKAAPQATQAGGQPARRAERFDGFELPPDLQREQSLAAEPEPKVVPLKRRKVTDEDPDEGPPYAVAVEPAPVPRLVHQNARAPQGLTRYKIRCVNYPEQPVRYVLAKTEADARAKYVQAVGLGAILAAIGEAAPTPYLVVKALPD